MKLIIAALALFFVANGSCQQDGQTYASIMPGKYSVNLSFVINGVESNGPPCTTSAPGSACLPQLYTGDTVKITYNVNTTTPANTTSTITLKGCYGPESSMNRAWRKPKPVIKDDKQCSVKIAAGLPPTGEYTYTVKDNTAPAVYRIMALEICPGNVACSLGKSVAFYQTQPINSQPGWLMAMVGVFSTIGPITLAAYFVTERHMKKNK